MGGDLVDYLRTGSGRVGIAPWATWRGKGLGAALLMAKLQATLRAVVERPSGPGAAGPQRLNTVLVQDGISQPFRDAVLRRGGTRRWRTSATSTPGTILPSWPVGRGSRRLGASSYPLGMLEDVAYRQGSWSCARARCSVIYSDGLTEARNAAGEEFGTERLRQAPGTAAQSPAQEAGRSLLREVDQFIGGSGWRTTLSRRVAPPGWHRVAVLVCRLQPCPDMGGGR